MLILLCSIIGFAVGWISHRHQHKHEIRHNMTAIQELSRLYEKERELSLDTVNLLLRQRKLTADLRRIIVDGLAAEQKEHVQALLEIKELEFLYNQENNES